MWLFVPGSCSPDRLVLAGRLVAPLPLLSSCFFRKTQYLPQFWHSRILARSISPFLLFIFHSLSLDTKPSRLLWEHYIHWSALFLQSHLPSPSLASAALPRVDRLEVTSAPVLLSLLPFACDLLDGDWAALVSGWEDIDITTSSPSSSRIHLSTTVLPETGPVALEVLVIHLATVSFYDLDNKTCLYCSDPGPSLGQIQVDHIHDHPRPPRSDRHDHWAS